MQIEDEFPFENYQDFRGFLSVNEAKRAADQEQTESQLEVMAPEGFQKDKTYPLFIALHGGGENIAEFKNNWISPRMKTEFIVTPNVGHWYPDDLNVKIDEAIERIFTIK